MKKIFYLLASVMLFNSCKVIQTLNELKKEEATIHSYTVKNKEIKFLPMHHLGKPIFYDDVKNKVIEYKSKGYKVYYEKVEPDLELDSTKNDVLKRKFRKITGINDSYKATADRAGVLKGYVGQPSYEAMGTDSSDIRADVTIKQLIIEFEKQNGIIVLDSMDLNTKFNTSYSRKRIYTKKQIEKVTLDFRNQFLVDVIKEKADSKILILYGALHRKGLEKLFLEL